jgi:peptide deformylase
MAVRPVRLYGDPVLRQKAREITVVDDVVRALVADMRVTMHAYQGIGLAGNQVGELQRVLVVDVPMPDETRAQYALINPVLDQRTGSDDAEEGCLSIPGVYEDVRRALRVRVRALDEFGAPVEFVATDYLARALQHEIDHLDGVLILDRTTPEARREAIRSLRPRPDERG